MLSCLAAYDKFGSLETDLQQTRAACDAKDEELQGALTQLVGGTNCRTVLAAGIASALVLHSLPPRQAVCCMLQLPQHAACRHINCGSPSKPVCPSQQTDKGHAYPACCHAIHAC